MAEHENLYVNLYVNFNLDPMPTVNFYLENRKNKKTGLLKESNVPILCHFHFDDQKLILNTGLKTERKDWRKERTTNKGTRMKVQRVKSQTGYGSWVNARLDKFEKELLELYWQIRDEKGTVTKDAIKSHFKKQNEKQSFQDIVTEYLDAKRTEFSYHTKKKVRSVLNQFCQFEIDRRKSIEFEAVNEGFIKEFKDYAVTKLCQSNNTINKSIKVFKTLMRYAYDQEYHSNPYFKDIKTSEQPGKIITLDWEELMALYNLELEDPGLRICRDGFLLQCFTSLRFSDLRNLKKSDIVNGNIDITNIKTRDLNQIPLNDYSREIIERYQDQPGNQLIPVLSNQKMNQYLKELGQLAGIDQNITIVQFYGKERKEFVVPKYEALTTHVGRKTFITTALILGMPTELVMSISNHKGYSTFKRYVNIANEAKQNAMDKYFSKG